MAKLILTGSDGLAEREITLRAINTIGRHPDQYVQILDRVVSKKHALITYVEDAYWLQDMGSRNGTFVSGRQVQGRTRLSDRDTITLGATHLIFLDDKRPQTRDAFQQVTIHQGPEFETAIRTRQKAQSPAGTEFLPESRLLDETALRVDYEKLRIAFELNQAVGAELDLDAVLERILDKAFEFTHADRGVILLLEPDGTLLPRAVKNRRSTEPFDISQTILNEVINTRDGVLSSDAQMDQRFGGSHSIMLQGIRSTMCVPLLFQDELLGVIHVDTRIATGVFTEKDLQILTVFGQQAAMRLAHARLAKRAEDEAVARHKLSRLLSPNLVEEVVKGSIAMDAKGGKLRDATVLFSDIRGFTSMSERMAPETMVSLLNEYFEIMVEIVFRHDGTLDKFIGDELMAVWGAPVHQDDHAERAIKAALEMMQALEDFNRFKVANGEDAICVGCGINCGSLVAGYLGSSKTLSYTVLGDTVNTASRLCSHAGAGEILVSTPMVEALGGRLVMETRPTAQLKGKAQPVPIFKVLALVEPESLELSSSVPSQSSS